MSYEIIYGKQFIKLSNDNFIPMIYGGSNNCYEVSHGGRERRERSWFNYRINNGISGTAKELLAFPIGVKERIMERNKEDLETYGEDWGKYEDNRFGYFSGIATNGANTHKSSYAQFENIFKLGMKQALTVEQLREGGISINVSTSQYDSKKLTELGLEAINEYPQTTAELERIIEDTKETYKGLLYVTLRGSEEDFKYLRKKHFPIIKKEKPLTEVTEGYAIKIDNYGYFIKRTKNGFKYSYNPKLWYSLKKANAVLKNIIEHSFIKNHNPTVETVKLSRPMKVKL